MTESEEFRNVAADSMAQGHIVELLLTDYLKRIPKNMRHDIATHILNSGESTGHLTNITPDFAQAELLSDVVVRMHGALDRLVGRALLRIEAGEAAARE